jgi:hypothetical protein
VPGKPSEGSSVLGPVAEFGSHTGSAHTVVVLAIATGLAAAAEVESEN